MLRTLTMTIVGVSLVAVMGCGIRTVGQESSRNQGSALGEIRSKETPASPPVIDRQAKDQGGPRVENVEIRTTPSAVSSAKPAANPQQELELAQTEFGEALAETLRALEKPAGKAASGPAAQNKQQMPLVER